MSLFGFRRRKLLNQARNGADSLLGLSVKETMTDYVVTIPPATPVSEAAAIMVGEDVSTLVIEEGEKPVGIMTERDFITKVPASEKALKLTVKRLMAGKGVVRTTKPESTLSEARRTLKEHRIRKLVVVNEDGFIAGIVTQSDLSKELYARIRVVAKQEGTPFTVAEAMTKRIVSAPRTASFATAKAKMMRSNVSALPVTDRKEYVGICTEYDVVAQFYDKGGKLEIRKIGDIMSAPIKAIPAELSIFEANMIMLFEKVRRLLVMDKGKVVGIVSQTDLVHACFDYVERLKKHIESDGPVIKAEDFVVLRRKESITSEYAGEHIRAYTVR